jgi:hypothetical protein
LTSNGIETASAAIDDTAVTFIGICPRVSATIQNEAVAASFAVICVANQSSNLSYEYKKRNFLNIFMDFEILSFAVTWQALFAFHKCAKFHEDGLAL